MDTQLISSHEWTASHPYPHDKILISNLSIVANAGVDVWGRRRAQPAKLSVTLHLNRPFASAAQDDRVDHSTVHYGILSKNIVSCVEAHAANWHSTSSFIDLIETTIKELTASSTNLLAALEVTVDYPKGSMLGEAAGYTVRRILPAGPVARSLHIVNVRVPCIIGVNDNERLQKQAVTANLHVDRIGKSETSDGYVELEGIVTKTIADSTFQTLESLASAVCERLIDEGHHMLSSGSIITLRVAKPVAVPFADAPAIEISRVVKES